MDRIGEDEGYGIVNHTGCSNIGHDIFHHVTGGVYLLSHPEYSRSDD